MHIATIFPMDTVRTSFGKPALMWGRVAANHSFLTALASAPDCGELTVVVPTRQDAQLLASTLLAGIGRTVNIVPFAGLAEFLQRQRIDVLHCLDPGMWPAAHLRVQLAPQPFVITGITHSMANDHFLSWALQNSANGVDGDDCLICTTPTAQRVIESAFARLRSNQPEFCAPRTRVIPLGVPGGLAGDQPQPAASRDTDAPFGILCLARMNPQFKMDFMPLLHLAAMLREQSPRPMRLTLAGAADEGRYLDYLREQVARQGLEEIVTFVPDPDETAKARLYQEADVFLSLSDNVQETFGLTIVEALASGLPIVASDWNGYRSLIEHGVSGFLVPTKTMLPNAGWEAVLAVQPDDLAHMFCAQTTAVDLDAAADHLRQLAADGELAASMGQAAAAQASRYRWENVLPAYFDLWRELQAARATRRETSPGPGRSSAINFLADFTGYPSSTLSVADRFVISPTGRELLAGRRSLHFYAHLEEIISLNVMTSILRACNESVTFGAVVGRLNDDLGCDSATVARNLLWLYKYGFLRLL